MGRRYQPTRREIDALMRRGWAYAPSNGRWFLTLDSAGCTYHEAIREQARRDKARGKKEAP